MGSLPSPVNLVTPGQPLVGTGSVNVIGPNLTRAGLYVFNPGNTNVIWITPQTTAQTPLNPGGQNNPAVVGGAGCIPIQPQQGLMLGPPNNMPNFTNGLNAIASAGSNNPFTIWEFYP